MTYKNRITRNTILCYLPIVVIFATIKMLSAFGLLNFLGSYASLVTTLIIQVGLLFTISIFMFGKLNKSKPKEVFKFYNFHKISIKAVLIAFLMGIVVYFMNVLITTFFNSFLSLLGYTSTSSGSGMESYPFWMMLINLVLTAVLPGICEETAHRGLLLRGLSPLGQRNAIIISSLMFGLLHLNIEQVFYATLIGFLLGYIASVCEVIYPAMIIHFTNNAISVFLQYSQFNKLGFENIFNPLNTLINQSPVLAMLVMIIAIALLGFCLFYLVRLLFKFTTMDKMKIMQKRVMNTLEKKQYLSDVKNISEGKSEEEIEFTNLRDILVEQGMEFGSYSEISENIYKDESPFKLDKITKIMLTTTFFIIGLITFFTFIWGVL